MDVMLLCPVFWKGELFCWVTNCLHQYDIGGITPGSFCPSARDAFDEGILIPPVKIVESNVIRRDIEEVYLRSSRKPSAVALDFRAQLAGNITARERITSLLKKYGADVVKGVMRKILDDGEKAFLNKLAKLPDGVWRDRTYVECCRPGDRQVHRVMLTLKKSKGKLIFENEGTDPQAGGINATYSGWRGAIMVAINELLCWEQYYAVGGALRHIDFNPTPGTLNCADFPASVSTAPVQCMEISLYPAYNVLSKMIYPDPELRRDTMCIGGTSQWPATIFRGIDQWGERYGYLLVDPIGGAIGAFSHADGISTGGQARTPICKLPNVEHTEQSFPVLFLYRKEITDSGGAGKFRGGLSAESCFIPHGTDRITHDTLSSGNAIPTSTGMMGGYPGAVNRYQFLRSSDIQERFSKSSLVNDIRELKGEPIELGLRQQDFTQEQDDVYAVLWSAAGGFGDPLERDPAKVEADINNGDVSAMAARAIYGVVLGDAGATGKEREKLRLARIVKAPSSEKVEGKVKVRATENLEIKGSRWCCARCSTDLGPSKGNYKAGCVRNDLPIEASNPIAGDPKRFIDPLPQFRQFCCPGCGLAIENEIAIESDPLLKDVELR
jgi:N-methylhydantoinase B